MMTTETLAPEELMELDSIINAIHALNQHDNPTRYAKRKVFNWYNLFSDTIEKKYGSQGRTMIRDYGTKKIETLGY